MKWYITNTRIHGYTTIDLDPYTCIGINIDYSESNYTNTNAVNHMYMCMYKHLFVFPYNKHIIIYIYICPCMRMLLC